ncbi:MAG: hypothetical protein LBV51_00700 [Acholeplasmatales bacterium]|jgi:hypothetical protein|nr:hypothetical protein [Acholeplasmatales bacterium]
MKKLFLLLFSCLLLVSVSSCGTIKSGFSGIDTKVLTDIYSTLAYELEDKTYKEGDEVIINISSGTRNYYEEIDGILEYIGYKSPDASSTLGISYNIDPYDNFAYQIISGNTVYTYFELPNYRSYKLGNTEPDPKTQKWSWTFSNSDKVPLTVTKELINNVHKGYGSLEIRLVSYKDKEELNTPILTQRELYPILPYTDEIYEEYSGIRKRVLYISSLYYYPKDGKVNFSDNFYFDYGKDYSSYYS